MLTRYTENSIFKCKLLSDSVSKKYLKNFLFLFLHLPLVIDTVTCGAPRVATVEIVLLGKSGDWEKILEKKRSIKSYDSVLFNRSCLIRLLFCYLFASSFLYSPVLFQCSSY
jgi:hypothetical protein